MFMKVHEFLVGLKLNACFAVQHSRHRQMGTGTTFANLALTVTSYTAFTVSVDNIIHSTFSKIDHKVLQPWSFFFFPTSLSASKQLLG